MVRFDVVAVVLSLLTAVALQGCGSRKAAPAVVPGGFSAGQQYYDPHNAHYPPAAGQLPYGPDHAYYPPAAGQPPYGHDHASYPQAAGEPHYSPYHASYPSAAAQPQYYGPDHAYYPPAAGQPPYGPDHAHHPPAAGQPPYGPEHAHFPPAAGQPAYGHDRSYQPDHAYHALADGQPPYGNGHAYSPRRRTYYPPAEPSHVYHHPGRMAVDGLLCEHSWTARWADGVRSTCRSYCCYHRNRFTHIRTRRSYCRVRERNREVLRQCVPRRPHSVALAVSPLEEPVELAAQDQASTNFEEPEGEETDGSMLQPAAQPLCVCFSVAALGMFALVAVKSRRSVGSTEQKEPLMES